MKMGTIKVYYGIFEYHNGELNCVYAPYTYQNDGWDGVDRLKAERKAKDELNRVNITYQVKRLHAPV